MSSTVHLTSTIRPVPERFDEVVEKLQQYAQYVEANEPGAIQFQFFRQKREGAPDKIIFVEQFKDKAALEAHRSSDASAALKKGAAAEGSLLAAPEIDVLELLGGFPQRG